MSGNYDPYLAVGAMLFMLGIMGFITRRNLLMMMLSAELMLHGVSLTFLAFGQIHGQLDGQVFAIFVLTVATCDAGIALALILSLYKRTQSLDVDLWTALREDHLPARLTQRADAPVDEEPPPPQIPALVQPGVLPHVDNELKLASQRGPRRKSAFERTIEYGDQDDDDDTASDTKR